MHWLTLLTHSPDSLTGLTNSTDSNCTLHNLWHSTWRRPCRPYLFEGQPAGVWTGRVRGRLETSQCSLNRLPIRPLEPPLMVRLWWLTRDVIQTLHCVHRLQQTLIGTGSQCLVYPMSTADIDWYRVTMCGLSSVFSRHWLVQGHNVWSIQCLQQTLIGTGS